MGPLNNNNSGSRPPLYHQPARPYSHEVTGGGERNRGAARNECHVRSPSFKRLFFPPIGAEERTSANDPVTPGCFPIHVREKGFRFRDQPITSGSFKRPQGFCSASSLGRERELRQRKPHPNEEEVVLEPWEVQELIPLIHPMWLSPCSPGSRSSLLYTYQ